MGISWNEDARKEQLLLNKRNRSSGTSARSTATSPAIAAKKEPSWIEKLGANIKSATNSIANALAAQRERATAQVKNTRGEWPPAQTKNTNKTIGTTTILPTPKPSVSTPAATPTPSPGSKTPLGQAGDKLMQTMQQVQASKKPTAQPDPYIQSLAGTLNGTITAFLKRRAKELAASKQPDIPPIIEATGGGEIYELVLRLPESIDLKDWSKKTTKQQLSAMQRSGLSDKEWWKLLNADDHYLEALGTLRDLRKNPRPPSLAEMIALDAEFTRFAEAQANLRGDAQNPQVRQLDDARRALLGGGGTKPATKPKTTPGLFSTPGPRTTPFPQTTPRPQTTPGPRTTPLPQPGPSPMMPDQGVDEVVARTDDPVFKQVLGDAGRKLAMLSNRDGLEYCTNLYSVTIKGEKHYFTGPTYRGGHNNVILPGVASVLAARTSQIGAAYEGFLHSHPNCTEHSENAFSSGDALMTILAGNVYLATPDGSVRGLTAREAWASGYKSEEGITDDDPKRIVDSAKFDTKYEKDCWDALKTGSEFITRIENALGLKYYLGGYETKAP